MDKHNHDMHMDPMSEHSMNDMDMDMNMDHDMMNHGGHMMHMGNLKQKFWVSLILTIPIILMSPMMGMKLPFQFFFHPWSDYLIAILGTILFFYGGKPFFSGAKGELQSKQPAMMTLIAMGISVAFVYSIYAVINNYILHAHPLVMDFFWELSTLIDIMLLGHWIEMDTVMNASSALDNLAKLLPSKAHKVINNDTEDVAVSALQKDDLVRVLAGEKVPADGIITVGATSINESMLTGEAKLVTKETGAQVIGGSVNGNDSFTMKITGTGESGYLAQVMQLVNKAQASKSAKENMADKVAGLLFYAALTVSIVAFIAWLIVDSLPIALSIAVTVLVIACPHSLGLAIPLVVARSTSIAAAHGLLIQNRDALEQVNQVKYVLMDKTGTLTEGNFKVHEYRSISNTIKDNDLLQLFASLEANSSHPLAVGILNAAKQNEIDLLPAENVKQQTGVGISGQINNNDYSIVSLNYVQQHQMTDDQINLDDLTRTGDTLSFLIQNKTVLGYVSQGDSIKQSAFELIKDLKKQNITPVMLTGDNQASAQKVADQLEIDDVHANLLPEDKEKLIRQYQATNQKVMMVGDGVNDAPSLARADIGVAIGSGTQVAISSADIVLVRSDPQSIIEFIDLAKKTTRKMTENLWWGAGYNIITIPLAAGILAPIGFTLSPMVGAVIMSFSTIIVALNAMSLKV
ncbi:heavy metal translocating P-type ATPase [Paucilactobacillus sp. N302-9]